jgi:hypothetical protein
MQGESPGIPEIAFNRQVLSVSLSPVNLEGLVGDVYAISVAKNLA